MRAGHQVRSAAQREADFRACSAAMSGLHVSVPTKYCSCCGNARSLTGGTYVTAMPGPVTRHNPKRFVCRGCKHERA